MKSLKAKYEATVYFTDRLDNWKKGKKKTLLLESMDIL